MLVPLHAPRRRYPVFEELEARVVLTATSPAFTVALSAQADRFGDQVLTAQAYGMAERLAFGIFDTGASAITFSAQDQERFTARDLPIPIKIPGGARVVGVGGAITGDVSEPGTIFADGLHAIRVWFDDDGQMQLESRFSYGSSGVAPRIQAMVGSSSSGGSLPTITGTPIFNGSQAALIDFRGVQFNFSSMVPGLTATLPDLFFVPSGTQLIPLEGSSDPFTIPLELIGTGAPQGDGLTTGPNPVQPSVQLDANGGSVTGRRMLFDTGAQMTVISTATARLLGLDLDNPSTTIGAQGVSGSEDLPGFTLERLVLPSDQGLLEFTDVSVVVADVLPGLDGILGMNLWNTALQLLYDPSGAPVLRVLFETDPEEHGPMLNEQTEAALQSLGVPFIGALQNTTLPTFTVASGRIEGRIFEDVNFNYQFDPREMLLRDRVLYLDENQNGIREASEPVTTTQSDGTYVFTGLAPGEYIVRVTVPESQPVLIMQDQVEPVQVVEGTTVQVPDIVAVPLSPNEPLAFVNGIYGNLLQRTADPAGQNYWTWRLQTGATYERIAREVWDSAEHRRMQVEEYYATYLGRLPNSGELIYWVGAFLRGATELQVEHAFLTSPEYMANHARDEIFLQGLYQDVLGRDADLGGLAYWLSLLQAGVSRAQVALLIQTSPEAYRRVVGQLYRAYLGREVDATGEQYWTSRLLSGQTDVRSTVALLLDSLEYRNKQRERVWPGSGQ